MEILIEEIAEMDSLNPIFDRSYEYTKTIASGAFGIVKSAIEKSTGNTVAVKIVNKGTIHSSNIAKIKREVGILKQLNHPNIINFINYSETNSKIYIVTEYIKDGTLRNWQDKNSKSDANDNDNANEGINEERIAEIIYYLLKGTSYIHSLDICHKDIKPDNIMFNDSNYISSLKLVDFGLSTQDIEQHDCSGTLLYMAPELFARHSSYTKEVDIWSVGIIASMLLNRGQHPFYFKGQKKKAYFQGIKRGYVYNANLSLMANDFLSKMLEPELNKRYTAFNALNHPWITRQTFAMIPLTIDEKLKKKILVQKLRDLFVAIIILNQFSPNVNIRRDCNNDDDADEDYINSLNQVSANQNEMFIIRRKLAFIRCNKNNVDRNKSIEVPTTLNKKELIIEKNNNNPKSPIKTNRPVNNLMFLISPHSRNESDVNFKKITDHFRNNNNKSNSKSKKQNDKNINNNNNANNNNSNNSNVNKHKHLSVTPSLSLFKIKKTNQKNNNANDNANANSNGNAKSNAINVNSIKSKKTLMPVNINNNKRISDSNSTGERYASLKNSNLREERQNNLPIPESPMKQKQRHVNIQTTDSSVININQSNSKTARMMPLSKSNKKRSSKIYQITKKHSSSSIDMNVNIMQMKLNNLVLPKLSS